MWCFSHGTSLDTQARQKFHNALLSDPEPAPDPDPDDLSEIPWWVGAGAGYIPPLSAEIGERSG
jgi:hypothetical protein